MISCLIQVKRFYKYRYLWFMLLPGLVYFFLFHYLPLWGLIIAFKDYKPFLGFNASDWVGLAHFDRLFADRSFWRALSNSLIINIYQLISGFLVPVILGLLLNEVRHRRYKQGIQTVLFLPHFLSWVIIYGITFSLFSYTGIVNACLNVLGVEAKTFLLEPSLFRPMIMLQQVWRDAGWGSIIILAALSGINPQLYEAAIVDGANRRQQFRHVTFPGIRSVLSILLVIQLGRALYTGFEQIYVMQTPLNYSVSDVIETYSYRTGILNANLSYATAIGLFQSVVGVLLVVAANWVVNKLGEEGIW